MVVETDGQNEKINSKLEKNHVASIKVGWGAGGKKG